MDNWIHETYKDDPVIKDLLLRAQEKLRQNKSASGITEKQMRGLGKKTLLLMLLALDEELQLCRSEHERTLLAFQAGLAAETDTLSSAPP